MNSINFKANFLKTVHVSKYINHERNNLVKTAIVELDVKNPNDIAALAKVASDWENITSGYGMQIYNNAIRHKLPPSVIAEHYYALTTQLNDYAKLCPEKILGLVSYDKKQGDMNEISWLQVHPKENYDSERSERNYRGIGKVLVDFIKTITDKKLMLEPDENAIPFYEKQGFLLEPNSMLMFYNKDIFKE